MTYDEIYKYRGIRPSCDDGCGQHREALFQRGQRVQAPRLILIKL